MTGSVATVDFELECLQAQETADNRRAKYQLLKSYLSQWQESYNNKSREIEYQKRVAIQADKSTVEINRLLREITDMERFAKSKDGQRATDKSRRLLSTKISVRDRQLNRLHARRKDNVDIALLPQRAELTEIDKEMESLKSQLAVLGTEIAKLEQKLSHDRALNRPQPPADAVTKRADSPCPPSIALLLDADDKLKRRFRVITFPIQESAGKLYTRNLRRRGSSGWVYLSEARGKVCIPKDDELRLVLTVHMSKLPHLNDGDIQELHFEDAITKFQGSGYVGHMKSLVITCGPIREWESEMVH